MYKLSPLADLTIENLEQPPMKCSRQYQNEALLVVFVKDKATLQLPHQVSPLLTIQVQQWFYLRVAQGKAESAF